MTMPRQILADSTYLITRRTHEGRDFMRPDEFSRNALLYCIGLAAKKHGVEICAFVQMANHYHIVVTDRSNACIPLFYQDLHRNFSKVMNAKLVRTDSMWSSERTDLLRLELPDDALSRIIYAMTNPTVATKTLPQHWKGAISLPQDYLRPIRATRPGFYFSDDGDMPAEVSFKLARPKGFEHLSDEQWVGLLEERLADRLEVVLESWKGRRAPKPPRGKPGSKAYKRPERTGVHREAVSNDKEAQEAANVRLDSFRREYRKALKLWREGKRDVVFPVGTYAMRVLHCAKTAGVRLE